MFFHGEWLVPDLVTLLIVPGSNGHKMPAHEACLPVNKIIFRSITTLTELKLVNLLTQPETNDEP